MTKHKPYLTHQRQAILSLLTITMLTPQILAFTGISKNLRSAQKMLRSLRKAGLIAAYTYKTAKGSKKFYYRNDLPPEIKYHEIKPGLLVHDSITAVFLCRLFQYGVPKNLTLRFHPPFPLQGKVADGAVTVMQENSTVQTMLLESDTGTHDHQEIAGKLAAYLPFLTGTDSRIILFLVPGTKRAANLRQLFPEAQRVWFISPTDASTELLEHLVFGLKQ